MKNTLNSCKTTIYNSFCLHLLASFHIQKMQTNIILKLKDDKMIERCQKDAKRKMLYVPDYLLFIF